MDRFYGCDIYNFQITGSIACNLNASSCNSPTHSGPSVIVLNDMGGEIMNVSDIPSTLRAQMKHHEPIVCYEEDKMKVLCFKERAGCPGGGKGILVGEDRSFTLATNFNGAICFEPGIAKREGSDSRFVTGKSPTLRANAGDNQVAVCYAVDSHPMDSRFEVDGDVSPTVTAKLAKGSADGPLVIVENGQDICD